MVTSFKFLDSHPDCAWTFIKGSSSCMLSCYKRAITHRNSKLLAGPRVHLLPDYPKFKNLSYMLFSNASRCYNQKPLTWNLTGILQGFRPTKAWHGSSAMSAPMRMQTKVVKTSGRDMRASKNRLPQGTLDRCMSPAWNSP